MVKKNRSGDSEIFTHFQHPWIRKRGRNDYCDGEEFYFQISSDFHVFCLYKHERSVFWNVTYLSVCAPNIMTLQIGPRKQTRDFIENSDFFNWLYSPLGPWPLIFSFMISLQTAGLLGRVISPSQGLYLNTLQHKQNKHIHIPNIHALCGIRNHDLAFQTSEDSTCLRALGYRDRLILITFQ
jgi:hypothetical protein